MLCSCECPCHKWCLCRQRGRSAWRWRRIAARCRWLRWGRRFACLRPWCRRRRHSQVRCAALSWCWCCCCRRRHHGCCQAQAAEQIIQVTSPSTQVCREGVLLPCTGCCRRQRLRTRCWCSWYGCCLRRQRGMLQGRASWRWRRQRGSCGCCLRQDALRAELQLLLQLLHLAAQWKCGV